MPVEYAIEPAEPMVVAFVPPVEIPRLEAIDQVPDETVATPVEAEVLRPVPPLDVATYCSAPSVPDPVQYVLYPFVPPERAA